MQKRGLFLLEVAVRLAAGAGSKQPRGRKMHECKQAVQECCRRLSRVEPVSPTRLNSINRVEPSFDRVETSWRSHQSHGPSLERRVKKGGERGQGRAASELLGCAYARKSFCWLLLMKPAKICGGGEDVGIKLINSTDTVSGLAVIAITCQRGGGGKWGGSQDLGDIGPKWKSQWKVEELAKGKSAAELGHPDLGGLSKRQLQNATRVRIQKDASRIVEHLPFGHISPTTWH
ncbi:hypothetical protein B0H16DRAFT_1460531 [Mycena metata]|uniref:Uncharacterized protein n=1 Tax=Mycena metata TaxID=1033252 RepID=A0AAD7IWJ6_9AGAR|nr:hypothetical protein B0H16DRAFT_1460531 [Mycena metata]